MACANQLQTKINAERSSNGLCEPASDKKSTLSARQMANNLQIKNEKKGKIYYIYKEQKNTRTEEPKNRRTEEQKNRRTEEQKNM